MTRNASAETGHANSPEAGQNRLRKLRWLGFVALFLLVALMLTITGCMRSFGISWSDLPSRYNHHYGESSYDQTQRELKEIEKRNKELDESFERMKKMPENLKDNELLLDMLSDDTSAPDGADEEQETTDESD